MNTIAPVILDSSTPCQHEPFEVSITAAPRLPFQTRKGTKPTSGPSPTGVLVECDPSIKSIIVNIDTKSGHEYIIDDLDDEHVVIKETMLQKLKQMLEDRLRETTQQHGGDESGSE